MSERTNASRHPQALLEQIAGVLGLPYADDNLPELVAKLAAREKLYTETVKALETEFSSAVAFREDLERMGKGRFEDYLNKSTPHLRQLLSLAREGGAK